MRARFPAIVGPKAEDICYATSNRQAAVKAMAAKAREENEALAKRLDALEGKSGEPITKSVKPSTLKADGAE